MGNAALDRVMQEAAEAASNYTPPALQSAPTNLPTPANNNGTQLARPSLAGALQGGGMDVDEYFQLSAEGLKVGKDFKGLLDDITVIIDMADVQVMYSARSEVGGATTFIKSYDGVTTSDGRNFQLAMDQLAARPGAKFTGPYESAEIPCELVDDVKDPKSNLVIDAGTLIGYTPSVTGFKPFRKFLKDLAKQDPQLVDPGARVKVKLVHEQKTNKNGNKWGVLNFELIEVVDD